MFLSYDFVTFISIPIHFFHFVQLIYYKLQEDLEGLFLNTEFKKIPGKSPEMIFYNQFGEEIERMDISNLVRSELVALLDKKGIARKVPKENNFKGEL